MVHCSRSSSKIWTHASLRWMQVIEKILVQCQGDIEETCIFLDFPSICLCCHLWIISIFNGEDETSCIWIFHRYTLRIKFFPEDLTSFYLKDKASFFFLYDQVISLISLWFFCISLLPQHFRIFLLLFLQIKNDYLNHVAEKVDQDIAFRLGALEMRYVVY